MRTRQIWAQCSHDPTQALADPHVHWVTERYIEQGIPIPADDFVSPDLQAIPQVPDADYYGASFAPGGEEVVLPERLGVMLAMVDRLGHEERRRFMRAAQWMASARSLWDHSVSSYYIALVAAIESLQSDEDVMRCSECNQVRDVTQRFRRFVERFVPPEAGERITRQRLYGIRSDLAHGRVVFDVDEAPWSKLAAAAHVSSPSPGPRG